MVRVICALVLSLAASSVHASSITIACSDCRPNNARDAGNFAYNQSWGINRWVPNGRQWTSHVHTSGGRYTAYMSPSVQQIGFIIDGNRASCFMGFCIPLPRVPYQRSYMQIDVFKNNIQQDGYRVLMDGPTDLPVGARPGTDGNATGAPTVPLTNSSLFDIDFINPSLPLGWGFNTTHGAWVVTGTNFPLPTPVIISVDCAWSDLC